MGLKSVSSVSAEYGTEILNAIAQNDLAKLREILEKRLKTNDRIRELCESNVKHRTSHSTASPVILAARLQSPAILRYMIERGVNPNFVYHRELASGRQEVVTPMHMAVDLSHYDVVDMLLDFNASSNIRDHSAETPLLVAVQKADWVMAQMLLTKGADPNVIDKQGNTCLHIATRLGHMQLVRTLVAFHADVNLKGRDGAIPVQIAAREGHTHLLDLFCSVEGTSVNTPIQCFDDRREKAPLHVAAAQAHDDAVRRLADAFDADVNLKDNEWNTALHYVVLRPYNSRRMRERACFTSTARVLLERRANPNARNAFGDTPLHLAAMNQFPKIVEILLQYGARPNAENAEHLKPCDIVPAWDHITRQLLKNAARHRRPETKEEPVDAENVYYVPRPSLPETTTQKSTGVPAIPVGAGSFGGAMTGGNANVAGLKPENSVQNIQDGAQMQQVSASAFANNSNNASGYNVGHMNPGLNEGYPLPSTQYASQGNVGAQNATTYAAANPVLLAQFSSSDAAAASGGQNFFDPNQGFEPKRAQSLEMFSEQKIGAKERFRAVARSVASPLTELYQQKGHHWQQQQEWELQQKQRWLQQQQQQQPQQQKQYQPQQQQHQQQQQQQRQQQVNGRATAEANKLNPRMRRWHSRDSLASCSLSSMSSVHTLTSDVTENPFPDPNELDYCEKFSHRKSRSDKHQQSSRSATNNIGAKDGFSRARNNSMPGLTGRNKQQRDDAGNQRKTAYDKSELYAEKQRNRFEPNAGDYNVGYALQASEQRVEHGGRQLSKSGERNNENSSGYWNQSTKCASSLFSDDSGWMDTKTYMAKKYLGQLDDLEDVTYLDFDSESFASSAMDLEGGGLRGGKAARKFKAKDAWNKQQERIPEISFEGGDDVGEQKKTAAKDVTPRNNSKAPPVAPKPQRGASDWGLSAERLPSGECLQEIQSYQNALKEAGLAEQRRTGMKMHTSLQTSNSIDIQCGDQRITIHVDPSLGQQQLKNGVVDTSTPLASPAAEQAGPEGKKKKEDEKVIQKMYVTKAKKISPPKDSHGAETDVIEVKKKKKKKKNAGAGGNDCDQPGDVDENHSEETYVSVYAKE